MRTIGEERRAARLKVRARSAYYRMALRAMTGARPPVHFKFRDNEQTMEQQDWCSVHVRPQWACGISLMEAAESFVVDAENNANIVTGEAGT